MNGMDILLQLTLQSLKMVTYVQQTFLCIYSKEFDTLQTSYIQDAVNQQNHSINQELLIYVNQKSEIRIT